MLFFHSSLLFFFLSISFPLGSKVSCVPHYSQPMNTRSLFPSIIAFGVISSHYEYYANPRKEMSQADGEDGRKKKEENKIPTRKKELISEVFWGIFSAGGDIYSLCLGIVWRKATWDLIGPKRIKIYLCWNFHGRWI